ncbi:MAG: hypoxanthine-guanine phosphoribosyltransferase [Gammaproteobacteria bacterium]|nr:hypoxanthine-guanine phosphoribosyltransferase [Gammaproteobacteria bacterium]MDH5728017.1 hypoxanthine-guanine phosphoribosyltransferase [Gammaproteobacteria bacterium]
MIDAKYAQAVLDRADLIFNQTEIEQALDRMAKQIETDFASTNPLVLCLMTGGLVATSELLLRLGFVLELDYIHATRYGHDTQGTDLKWIAKPRKSLKGRNVLVIDDILDEGQTLAAILQYCHQQEVASVKSAVLVEKEHDRKNGISSADYTGLIVPDRYVFGFGMDYKGYLRNVPGIYAAKAEDE